jgi:ADP-ribosylation factor family
MTYVTRKNGVKIVFTDVGGARDMRHAWRQFYREADAVVNILFFELFYVFFCLFYYLFNRIAWCFIRYCVPVLRIVKKIDYTILYCTV